MFLDGLATAWQNLGKPPRPRRRKSATSGRRTRIDPFAHSWPLVEEWLRAEPNALAKALMQRLREQFPDVYPSSAQLRTLQRRVQLWRHEQIKRLIFASAEVSRSDIGANSRPQNIEPMTIQSEVEFE